MARPRSAVHGVGVNDAPYPVRSTVNGKRTICPYYSTWAAMLQRCYDTKFHVKHPSYAGCTVHTPWLTFSVFRTWMKQQNWQGMALDKDLKQQGNKLYSPDTCLFIPQEVNQLITVKRHKLANQLAGVSVNSKGYIGAFCNNKGKTVFLGNHPTAAEAHEAYKVYKYALLAEAADSVNDPELKEAILNFKL